jgi:hypothetical protein
VLQTPDNKNPFGSGGEAFTCIQIAPNLVSPFGPAEVPGCTVNRRTTLIVTPATYECSTFEETALADLRSCAKSADAGVTTAVTLDDEPVNTREVETVLIPLVMPKNNIFGAPAGSRGFSVGHGWISILKQLSKGPHTIHVTASGPKISVNNTTTITVR